MSQKPSPTPGPKDRDGQPEIAGEGNVSAARRHRDAAERFVRQGRVGPAAEEAAPKDDTQAGELERAEEAGRSRAKR